MATGVEIERLGLGRLERLDLQSFWGDQLPDLTPWFLQNVDLLSQTLGCKITPLDEEDAGDGPFPVIGTDDRGRPVVIGNQPEPSNHRQLGEMIVHASALESAVVVWVAPRFHHEYRRALEWLNERTDVAVDFVAVELGLVRIGRSLPAPVLDVVVSPPRWRRAGKRRMPLNVPSSPPPAATRPEPEPERYAPPPPARPEPEPERYAPPPPRPRAERYQAPTPPEPPPPPPAYAPPVATNHHAAYEPRPAPPEPPPYQPPPVSAPPSFAATRPAPPPPPLPSLDGAGPAAAALRPGSPPPLLDERSPGAITGEVRHTFYRDMFEGIARRQPGFRTPKYGYESWVGFAAGPFGFYDVAFTANGAVRAGIYLDMQERTATKRLFDDLRGERLAIETAVGATLSWERLDDRRASRIVDYRDLRDPTNPGDLLAAADWAADTIVRMMHALDSRLRSTAQMISPRV